MDVEQQKINNILLLVGFWGLLVLGIVFIIGFWEEESYSKIITTWEVKKIVIDEKDVTNQFKYLSLSLWTENNEIGLPFYNKKSKPLQKRVLGNTIEQISLKEI